MESVPGLGPILSVILDKCGIIPALSFIAAVGAIIQLARVRAAWDTYREKSTGRLDEANATILKLVESSNKTDTDVAIALEGVKTILIALQARGSGN